tara:strand:- start:138 stop:263 length:126 start_codon:yes stop_codon:yes gene_type:complete
LTGTVVVGVNWKDPAPLPTFCCIGNEIVDIPGMGPEPEKYD